MVKNGKKNRKQEKFQLFFTFAFFISQLLFFSLFKDLRKMNGLIEFKSMHAEIKDVDTVSKTVTGYFSAFGNKDFDNDVIVKGSFAKSIMERGPMGRNEIFYLNQHSWAQPLGRPSVLMEDEKGLYFESNVTEASFGKDALILYEEGLVKEHSIGFVTIKDSWIKPSGEFDKDSYREIHEVKLYEGSAVTLGANNQTPFTGFKSKGYNYSQKENESMISKIVKLLRNGELTDETFIQLEIALKQLQRYAYELGKESLKATEPDVTTQKAIEPIVVDVDKVFANWLN